MEDLEAIRGNLASLNEIVTEMVQALSDHGVGDQPFATLVREQLRDASWNLGYQFQGQGVPR